MQTCTDIGTSTCLEYTYTGRLDNIQVSIPMLEAMGLITLWLIVFFTVITLFKKFS